jgi:hypothetical protein
LVRGLRTPLRVVPLRSDSRFGGRLVAHELVVVTPFHLMHRSGTSHCPPCFPLGSSRSVPVKGAKNGNGRSMIYDKWRRTQPAPCLLLSLRDHMLPVVRDVCFSICVRKKEDLAKGETHRETKRVENRRFERLTCRMRSDHSTN